MLTALCFGWIDGQKAGGDETAWLQKFTPRGSRSVWSKLNRERVAELIDTGRMRPSGAAAVERAKKSGQWDAAYDTPKTASVPPEFQAELDKSKSASAFFANLNSANRYAMLWRIQTAKQPETKARRIQTFIAMLKRKEIRYP
ncbi:MAG: YdeI/OmpD-associated family protein [Fibrobacteria bacterium]